jgi:hypothetical protein
MGRALQRLKFGTQFLKTLSENNLSPRRSSGDRLGCHDAYDRQNRHAVRRMSLSQNRPHDRAAFRNVAMASNTAGP